jgi:hypothetical protein
LLLEKEEMVDIILLCDKPTTTLLINLLSESAEGRERDIEV